MTGRSLSRALVVVALCLALSGCSAALMAVGAAASLSTLLKNEANCSLADISQCTMPKIGIPVVAPTAP